MHSLGPCPEERSGTGPCKTLSIATPSRSEHHMSNTICCGLVPQRPFLEASLIVQRPCYNCLLACALHISGDVEAQPTCTEPTQ